MGVLDVLGQAATVVGKGFQGYGEDEQNRAAQVLAEAKAAQEAERNRIASRVALAGIDPTVQGDLARSRSAGTTEGANPGLASRERILGAIRTTNKVADINATAAPTANAEALKIDTTAAPEAHAAGMKAKELEPINVEQAKQESENAAAAGERHAAPTIVPTDNGVVRVPRHGSAEVVTDQNGQPVIKTAAGAGAGMVRFGQGGPLGAASGLASIKEMHAAHANMQAFEKGLLGDIPTTQLDALDRFRQRLASGLHDGVFDAAKASEAERELAKTNPELVTYGRNLAQWIVGDMNLSRGGTDARARQDENVSGLSVPLSSMTPAQRATYIQQIWEGRMARTSGLDQAVPAVEAMLKRAAGTHGTTAPDHTKLSDEEFARQYKAGAFNHPP